MASSATLNVTNVVDFFSTSDGEFLVTTQHCIDKINAKLRNEEMKAWIDAGCTTNIYETINQVVVDEQTRPIKMVNTSTNKYTTLKADVKTAKAILAKGLSIVYKGLVYPTSHVDLKIELNIIEQYRLNLIKNKINPIPQHPLTILQAKDIYQAIAKGYLSFHKGDADNRADTPHIEPAEEFKLNLDCSKTELIGAGAFGITFKVWDIIKRKYFAIKRAIVDSPLRERELHISDLLRGAGEDLDKALVKQYGYHYDRENKCGFIIMEYIEHDVEFTKLLCDVENNYDPQQSYKSLPDLYNKLPIPNVANIIYRLANAVHALHGAGIVHRDIKPSNFMLLKKPKDQEFHQVKLFDFGMGKVLPVKDAGRTATDFLTSTNIGNVIAKAPEMSYLDYNGRLTDLYAIGMNALLLVFGYSPGCYKYYLDKNNPVPNADELKKQRLAMPSIGHYIKEYNSFVENAAQNGNADNIPLLKARLAEFKSDKCADFRDALNYLVDSQTPSNREKFFETNFVKSVGHINNNK